MNVPLSRRRTYMTYVALACDTPAAQRVLPQVIVGNFHTLPAKCMGALRAPLPANVTLLRQRSAWNNNLLCATIIRMIAAALAPFAGASQPVIFFDAARCHLNWNGFAACARFGIWPILVPAKLTWLLQPLDTHVFASFKRRAQAAALRVRCAGEKEGNVLKQVLAARCEAIETILLGSAWAHAFASNGFSDGQAGLSRRGCWGRFAWRRRLRSLMRALLQMSFGLASQSGLVSSRIRSWRQWARTSSHQTRHLQRRRLARHLSQQLGRR